MAKAYPITRNDGKIVGYAVTCPACGRDHLFNVAIEGEVNKPGRPCWTFNGNVNIPTFSPSMLCFVERTGGVRETTCHSFVREGRIEYLDDCKHSLRGQTVELPEVES